MASKREHGVLAQAVGAMFDGAADIVVDRPHSHAMAFGDLIIAMVSEQRIEQHGSRPFGQLRERRFEARELHAPVHDMLGIGRVIRNLEQCIDLERRQPAIFRNLDRT